MGKNKKTVLHKYVKNGEERVTPISVQKERADKSFKKWMRRRPEDKGMLPPKEENKE